MIIIQHRVNKLIDYKKVPFSHGIEVDVRYHENNLILNHEPFDHHTQTNTKLIDLLKKWSNKGPIVLNLKSEGIENVCIETMRKYKIKNWFFLDMSMPYFVNFAEKAFNKKIKKISPANLAVRFSDKEPIEYALSFQNKATWVWVDYFKEFPLTKKNYLLLKSKNFKICLVSPEIQKNSILDPRGLVEICSDFKIDAVCTKKPELWIES